MDTPTTDASLDNSIPFIAPNVEEPEHPVGSTGSVIAILLIVFLLVIGAFYVWGQRLSEQRANEVVPAVAQ
jgi:hypothetical protein